MSLAADERPEHSGVLDTEAAQLDFMSLQSIEDGLQIHIHESTRASENAALIPVRPTLSNGDGRLIAGRDPANLDLE